MSSSLFLVAFVKESISIHDSADLVGKIANSFPNIIPNSFTNTKLTILRKHNIAPKEVFNL